MMTIPLFIGFQPSQVVQDFIHQQYDPCLLSRPYLESPEHYLNSFVLGCRAATEKASSAVAEDAAAAALAAHDALDHLALELASDLGGIKTNPSSQKNTEILRWTSNL